IASKRVLPPARGGHAPTPELLRAPPTSPPALSNFKKTVATASNSGGSRDTRNNLHATDFSDIKNSKYHCTKLL
ncbi:MAG: hypothetical protein Q8J90_03570, partial [Gallionella sp.]|nr:hypothetical protein [Gallionella sp.]